jgi:hypothetical protein
VAACQAQGHRCPPIFRQVPRFRRWQCRRCPTGGRKRKATADVDGEDVDSKSAEDKSDSANKSDGKAKTKKKAPAAKPKSRPAKKTKKEVKEEEDSADGGDGMGEYTLKQSIVKWLNSTDGSPDAEEDVEGED